MLGYSQFILANGRCMSPNTSASGSIKSFFIRELRFHHLHWFWLPIILYFILGVQYYQANVGGIGTDLPFNLVGWGLTGTALAAGLWSLYLRGKIKVSRQIAWIGCLMACLFIPFAFNEAHGQSSTWFRFIALPIIWFFLLMSLQYRVTMKTRVILISAILIGICAQTIIGFAQLTIMEHDFPPFGHFQQTNLMGSYITTGIACMYWLIAMQPKASHWRWITLFSVICLLAGIVGSELESRATLPNGVVVGVIGSVYLLRQKQSAPVMLVIAFLAGWFFNTELNSITPPLITDTVSVSEVESPKEVAQNVEERLILYPQVIQMVADNPITGVGYGNFESAYIRFSAQQAAAQAAPHLIRHNMAHPHNEILYWAVEGGIIATLSVISIFVLLFYWFINKPLPHKFLVFALFFPITGHIFIEYPLHSSLPHLLLVLIFARLFILDEGRRYLVINNNIAPLFRPLALITGLGAITFSITGLHTNKLVLDYALAPVKTPEPYLRIINPFVHYERYWTHIMSHKAIAGVRNNNEQAITDYIMWAEAMVGARPRKVYWENIIRLKQHLDHDVTEDCRTYELYFPPKRCTELLTVN